MSQLLSTLRSKTQSMTCSEHGKRAEINISGDKITLSCCCESFRKKIGKTIEKATSDFIQSETKKMFGKLK